MKNYIENPQEVAYLKAEENYSFLMLANGKKVLKSRPIKFYEASFLAQGWCRIHRSYMVNPIFVSHISADRDFIHLENGKELPIARRKQKQVFQWRKEQF
jgi:DNA-binding LytR/AlgR family response regulator